MKRIAQRELLNHSGEILREAEKGAHFLITVEGRPVALLSPYLKRRWVPKAEVVKLSPDRRGGLKLFRGRR